VGGGGWGGGVVKFADFFVDLMLNVTYINIYVFRKKSARAEKKTFK